MPTLRSCTLILFLLAWLSRGALAATVIEEILEPSGGDFDGTFVVKPDETIWAFGVGTTKTQDVSVNGRIENQLARRHWVPRLISRSAWDNGVDWEAAKPINPNLMPPSDFSLDTNASNWEWGSATDVAFYFLYETGNPALTLNPGGTYDNFKFFSTGPESTFATYAQDGALLEIGETEVIVTPIPPTLVLLPGALIALFGISRCRKPVPVTRGASQGRVATDRVGSDHARSPSEANRPSFQSDQAPFSC